jgi:hypothetical protein
MVRKGGAEKSFGDQVFRKEVMENVLALMRFKEVTFFDDTKVGKKGGDETDGR